jgi:hypothetical protein
LPDDWYNKMQLSLTKLKSGEWQLAWQDTEKKPSPIKQAKNYDYKATLTRADGSSGWWTHTAKVNLKNQAIYLNLFNRAADDILSADDNNFGHETAAYDNTLRVVVTIDKDTRIDTSVGVSMLSAGMKEIAGRCPW